MSYLGTEIHLLKYDIGSDFARSKAINPNVFYREI
jgi:hypothetical protein